MAKKVPRFFKKQLTERQIQSKYLKYIGQPTDRTFLSSCYALDADDGGLFKLKGDLGEDKIKRLAELKKAIKANQGLAVKLAPLTITAAIVAGLLFFFTVLANPLLGKAVETGLEAIFEAKVNVRGFRMSLAQFEVAMRSLTIADRDQPMSNLIEFSTMRIKLKPEAILKGKVYIEEIRADNIRFGTERTVSGTIPGKPPRVKDDSAGFSIPPLVDLSNFDPMALLNQEFDKLQSPKLYDNAAEAYDTALARWSGEEQATRARIAELQAMAEPLLAINTSDFRTLDAATIAQIAEITGDINAMMAAVQAAQDELNLMVAGIQGDINNARALEQSARNAFAEDFGRLRSYLDPRGDAFGELLDSVLMGILSETVLGYLDYLDRGIEILGKVKEMQEVLPKSAPKPDNIFRGRDVALPSHDFPRFFLGTLATDLLTPSGWHWGFDLQGVSSDPDFSAVPTSIVLGLAESADGLSRSGSFNAMADFRSTATERFNAEISGGGFPVSISAGLEQAGIGGFSGGATFSASARGGVDGGFSAGGSVSLANAALAAPASTFAMAADEAIRRVASVNLGLMYTRVVDGRDQFTLNTNFGAILLEAMTAMASQYIRQAEAELERALRSRISQHVDERVVSSDELDQVFAAIRGDRDAAAGLRNSLDSKRNELDNRLRGAADDVRDQAQQQAQQAVQDILQGRTPSAPSLPSIPGSLRR
ncbi:MAG: hypothetical protein FWH19_00570 [Treponema sp.]|nr:hypothetical protein [Treponema sp.]